MLTKIIGIGALVAATGWSSATYAQTAWQQAHPRRTEVNGRLANQNARITAGVRNGELSHAQARQLRSDDHAIRAEERADAAVNNGHITRGEQHIINQQENANSRAIYGEKH